MNELARTKTTAIAVTSANGRRKQLATCENVQKALTRSEQRLLNAMTGTAIEDIEKAVLIKEATKIFKYAAYDVGCQMPTNPELLAYTMARLANVLMEHYPHNTLEDVKLAFELTATGKLDNYFAKTPQGTPDKNHYQHFSVEYLCKVMNAYNAKSGDVEASAISARGTLEPPKETAEQVQQREAQRFAKNIQIFNHYKQHGELCINLIDAKYIAEWLERNKIIGDIEITDSDRNKAYLVYMHEAVLGIVNKYAAYKVYKDKQAKRESPELDYKAFIVAREKAIKAAFDTMIKNEVNINVLR